MGRDTQKKPTDENRKTCKDKRSKIKKETKKRKLGFTEKFYSQKIAKKIRKSYIIFLAQK